MSGISRPSLPACLNAGCTKVGSYGDIVMFKDVMLHNLNSFVLFDFTSARGWI